MNKKTVEALLPKALEALSSDNCEICTRDKDGKRTNSISKTYRGQISSFGAAVTMGSFKSAVAFFSEKGGSKTERNALLCAMYYVLYDKWISSKDVFAEVVAIQDPDKLSAEKEKYINASLAIKLAMNAFDLEK